MLCILYDNKGSVVGWFFDDVIVDIFLCGDYVVFLCYCWLVDDEDDGKIECELYLGY